MAIYLNLRSTTKLSLFEKAQDCVYTNVGNVMFLLLM